VCSIQRMPQIREGEPWERHTGLLLCQKRWPRRLLKRRRVAMAMCTVCGGIVSMDGPPEMLTAGEARLHPPAWIFVQKCLPWREDAVLNEQSLAVRTFDTYQVAHRLVCAATLPHACSCVRTRAYSLHARYLPVPAAMAEQDKISHASPQSVRRRASLGAVVRRGTDLTESSAFGIQPIKTQFLDPKIRSCEVTVLQIPILFSSKYVSR
jgi:hypothetical protein